MMLMQDLRFALRVLRKNPGFSLISFLTLTLGIGATTAIFSVVYGVLLRPLSYERPDEIVRLWETSSSGHRMNFADPNFDESKRRTTHCKDWHNIRLCLSRFPVARNPLATP